MSRYYLETKRQHVTWESKAYRGGEYDFVIADTAIGTYLRVHLIDFCSDGVSSLIVEGRDINGPFPQYDGPMMKRPNSRAAINRLLQAAGLPFAVKQASDDVLADLAGQVAVTPLVHEDSSNIDDRVMH